MPDNGIAHGVHLIEAVSGCLLSVQSVVVSFNSGPDCGVYSVFEKQQLYDMVTVLPTWYNTVLIHHSQCCRYY